MPENNDERQAAAGGGLATQANDADSIETLFGEYDIAAHRKVVYTAIAWGRQPDIDHARECSDALRDLLHSALVEVYRERRWLDGMVGGGNAAPVGILDLNELMEVE